MGGKGGIRQRFLVRAYAKMLKKGELGETIDGSEEIVR